MEDKFCEKDPPRIVIKMMEEALDFLVHGRFDPYGFNAYHYFVLLVMFLVLLSDKITNGGGGCDSCSNQNLIRCRHQTAVIIHLKLVR